MCTVTIIPKGNDDFVLTSNRDESPDRFTYPPDFYILRNKKLLYPKDAKEGGTWIGISEKNRVVCMLNGASSKQSTHILYNKSRGQVAKDFMLYHNVEKKAGKYNFSRVKPFVMVIVDWKAGLKLSELVWDGQAISFKSLPLEPTMWSSTSLYSEDKQLERLKWFDTFRERCKLNAHSVLMFHKMTERHNPDYGLIMNRGYVRTTSITQIDKTNDFVRMYYEDILNKDIVTKNFNQHAPSNAELRHHIYSGLS